VACALAAELSMCDRLEPLVDQRKQRIPRGSIAGGYRGEEPSYLSVVVHC
jgi:hypothetical protein